MHADSSAAIGALIAGLLLLAFATPLRLFWTNTMAPWWLIFVPCACAVTALFVHERVRGAREDEPEEPER